MDYQTFEPGIELSAFVKCFWVLDGPSEENPEKQRIVSDGCIEMIFHYGDLYKQYLPDGRVIIQPKCFVFGQITRPLDIEPSGTTGIFAVRFLQPGFTPFSTKPIHLMENRATPLDELFGVDGQRLGDDVIRAKSIAEKIYICEKFLLSRSVNAEAVDEIVHSSVEMILELNGNLSVDRLSQELNVGRRQLERKFSAGVGMSPKQLSKIIRLQSALQLLFNNQSSSLTEIAHNSNYHDQSHFIKDFKEFTGLSPKQFFAGNLKMSAMFYASE